MKYIFDYEANHIYHANYSTILETIPNILLRQNNKSVSLNWIMTRNAG